MEIKSFKKLKDNKYKVELDNSEDITLYDDIIVEYNLLVNKELDDKKLKEIIKVNNKKDAYYLALKQLNKKMRTKKEIYKYLKKYDHNDSTINEIIDKLYEENYLNDERYIKAYINDQVNLTDKGPLKIRKELNDLGFETTLINDYLDTINDEVWIDKINKYITKKLKSSTNLSAYKLKMKIVTDLANKGYYKELIMDIIDAFEFKDNQEVLIKEYNKMKAKLEKKYSGSELLYYLKNKLLAKGFKASDIEEVIKESV